MPMVVRHELSVIGPSGDTDPVMEDRLTDVNLVYLKGVRELEYQVVIDHLGSPFYSPMGFLGDSLTGLP